MEFEYHHICSIPQTSPGKNRTGHVLCTVLTFLCELAYGNEKGPCQNGESTILARPFFFFKLYCGKLALSVSFFAHCPRGVLLLWFSFAYLIVYSARDRREMRLELSTPGPTAHFAVYGGASRSCMPGSVKSTQLPLYTSLVA